MAITPLLTILEPCQIRNPDYIFDPFTLDPYWCQVTGRSADATIKSGNNPHKGVYLFYDYEIDTYCVIPIYVGKSVKLRSRIAQHFHTNKSTFNKYQKLVEESFSDSQKELACHLRIACWFTEDPRSLETKVMNSLHPILNTAYE